MWCHRSHPGARSSQGTVAIELCCCVSGLWLWQVSPGHQAWTLVMSPILCGPHRPSLFLFNKSKGCIRVMLWRRDYLSALLLFTLRLNSDRIILYQTLLDYRIIYCYLYLSNIDLDSNIQYTDCFMWTITNFKVLYCSLGQKKK